MAKETKPRSLCSDIRAEIEISLPISTGRLFSCFLPIWGNAAPVYTWRNIRHFWFMSMVRIRNDYCLAFCWMDLFSLQKTLSYFGCKSIRLCFSGHVFKWIKPSLPSYSVSGLCNQPSLAFPGPPAAPAAHKHYKWESTNILYLVLNYLSTEKVKHWQTEFCETFLHLQTTNSLVFLPAVFGL